MQVLGIETSTFALGISLIKSKIKPQKSKIGDAEIMFDLLINSGMPAGEKIIEIIDRWVSTPKDIDGIGVSLGPGSFTGLRVGLSFAKGLAMALNKPVIGVPTLDAFAVGFPYTGYKITPIMDAKMGEVYTATYENGKRITSCLTIPINKLLENIEGEHIFVGDGVKLYSEVIIGRLGNRAHFVLPSLKCPRASWVAQIAMEQLTEGKSHPIDSLEPIYLHPPRIIKK